MVMAIYLEVGAILIALFFLYVLIRFIGNPLHIIANSIVGILFFLGLNTFFNVGIPISFLSVGVVAIGGILGGILVFLLHVTHLAF